MPDNADDPTLPASAEPPSPGIKIGHGGAAEQTLASVAPASDDTLAPDQVSAGAPVVVRAGGPGDYTQLLTIERQHYVVGKEIARGGMGRILSARDRRLGRAVAVKELLSTSNDLRARFEREARITAKLQHPAIVNILEAGTWPSGEPFYVMKLVSGESLDRAIASRSNLEQRLELLPNVIAVVDALAYAHNMRVIHRDLKPANVLVGEFGETVVIDWGLAKDLAEAGGEVALGPYRSASVGETVAGSVMGTPAYMPAEQAEGDVVDERADVYSLGAMLYHVLVGSAPYVGRTTDEIIDQVIAGPPPPIDQRAAGVPPDLVTIVNKAMAHVPDERYRNAKELADDLKKFQTGQLVGAHRYSTWELAKRWIRRHRTPVVVAAIAIVLMTGLGLASLRRIVREQQNTEIQRQDAETNRGQAEDLLTYMLTGLREQLQPLGKLPILGEVAQKAARYYDDRHDALDDAAQHKRVAAHDVLATILLQQNDTAGALGEAEMALALDLQRLVRSPHDPEVLQDLEIGHSKLGDVFRTRGRLADALSQYRAALAIETAPTNKSQYDRATDLDAVGYLLMATGDLKGATESLRAGQQICKRLVAIDKTNGWQHELWVIDGELGDALLAGGDATGALDAYQASLVIANELVAADRTDAIRLRDVAATQDRIAAIHEAQGERAGALATYRDSLATIEQLLTHDPTNLTWRLDAEVGHATVARVLQSSGDDRGALAELRKATTIGEELTNQDPTNTDVLYALAHGNLALGELLEKRNDLDEAFATSRVGLARAEKAAALAPTNATIERLLYNAYDDVGGIYLKRGERTEALESFRNSLKIAKHLASQAPTSARAADQLALASENVGDALHATDDDPGALEQYRSVIPIREAMLARDPANADNLDSLATCHRKIGDILLSLHQGRDALVELRAALEISQRLADASPSDAELAATVLRLKAHVASCCGG